MGGRAAEAYVGEQMPGRPNFHSFFHCMTNETMSAKASAFSIDAIMTATTPIDASSAKSTSSHHSSGESQL